MNSVWVDTAEKINFDSLNGNIRTDVLIVGGGIAGLLCAYMLKKEGVDCVLVESKEICQGITKNTTAKITLQHGLIYDKLISEAGYETAKLYLRSQINACKTYSQMCENIDCDYEKKDSYVYSLKSREKIEKEVNALNKLGLNASFCEAKELPIDVKGAVCVKDQAQFHPLKFAYSIAKDLRIYENTKVLEFLHKKVKTNRGDILCDKIIVATHFPIINKHGAYFLKMYQHRSYVLALENAKSVNGMYVDEDLKGLSFRNYGKYLLLGGGSHRTGKNGGNWQELEEFSRKVYPSAKIINRWATQDCMTLDGVPYIGKYSDSTKDLYVATGFNKWGMTSSMVSALLLKDMVTGRKSEYEKVYDPSRNMLRPQLAVNIFESTVGLLKPTVPRCPHLGCALTYNKAEHSWDCSCHGSRFTEDGQLIDNPACDDKKKI